MARTNTAAEEPQGGQVVPLSGPPSALANRVDEAQGRGLSQDQADNIVPLVYILQPNSPQCTPQSPKAMPGATAGMIWLRSAPKPLIPGDIGMLFQPVHFWKEWVEWLPRNQGGGEGAGFIGRHDERPEDAEEKPDPLNPQRMRWMRPNGHELVETRNHAGYVLGLGTPLPYVIPLSGTGHTFSRDWMMRQNTGLIQPSGKRLDSWWKVWLLKTQFRKNQFGQWFMYTVEEPTEKHGFPGGWIQTEADLDRAIALSKSFLSGEKVAEAPAERQEEQTSAAGQHI